METAAQVIQAALTPMIAVVVAYIAWQQWKTNERKVRLDLYDRRMEVFRATTELVAIVVREADVEVDELMAFMRRTAGSNFLFGPEITAYVNELYHRGLDLRKWSEQCLGSITPEACDKMAEELRWFTNQFEAAQQKFGKYLNLTAA